MKRHRFFVRAALLVGACSPPPPPPPSGPVAAVAEEVAADAPVEAPPVVASPPVASPPIRDDATIAGPPPVRAIGVGEHLSCALLESGEVRCWGATRLAAMPVATTPFPVGIADGVSLGVGDDHVCVARADGSVWCWGSNRDGALGDGTTVDRDAPTQVSGLADIVEVVGGGSHTCARDGAGDVWCWGHPGTVGHADAAAAHRPGRVVPMPAARHLVAGDDVTCATLQNDGPPRCWGFNTTTLFGRALGPVLRPVVAEPLKTATVFGLGHRTVCLAGADGFAYCAGSDAHGELGDQRVPDDARCDPYAKAGVTCTWTDPPPPRHVPRPGEHPPPERWPPPVVAPPATHTEVFARKSNFVHAGMSGRAVAFAGALARTCAISETGAVWCWGQMYFSRDWSHRTPRRIEGVSDAVAIAVAQEHACALLTDRTVRCWGYNRSGELGNGAFTETSEVSPIAAPVRW